jgi:hypothetical protein
VRSSGGNDYGKGLSGSLDIGARNTGRPIPHPRDGAHSLDARATRRWSSKQAQPKGSRWITGRENAPRATERTSFRTTSASRLPAQHAHTHRDYSLASQSSGVSPPALSEDACGGTVGQRGVARRRNVAAWKPWRHTTRAHNGCRCYNSIYILSSERSSPLSMVVLISHSAPNRRPSSAL